MSHIFFVSIFIVSSCSKLWLGFLHLLLLFQCSLLGPLGLKGFSQDDVTPFQKLIVGWVNAPRSAKVNRLVVLVQVVHLDRFPIGSKRCVSLGESIDLHFKIVVIRVSSIDQVIFNCFRRLDSDSVCKFCENLWVKLRCTSLHVGRWKRQAKLEL